MIDIDSEIYCFKKWLSCSDFANPYSEVSIQGYTAQIRRFLELLDFEGVESMKEASIVMLRKFVRTNQNGDKSKRSSQYVKMAALLLFYGFLTESDDSLDDLAVMLQEENLEKKTRTRGGRGGFKEKRLVPVLSWKEIERLLNTLDEGMSYSAIRDKAMARFILDTGLRASEVVSMTVNDANAYFDGRIRIIGKGNKERLIRFQPEGVESMRNWLQVRHQGFRRNPVNDILFITDQGHAIPAKALHTVVYRWLQRAGIHKSQSGPHLLRHTAASAWLAKGMDLRQVQENMGHANITTSSRYLHLLD